MTTGRGSDPVAQCRSWAPISTTSALDFSNSTVARRTVQTLIGSYVALSTSTRPPLQRPEPSEVSPCRRSLSGTDPNGPGGTAVPTWRILAVRPGGSACRRAARRGRKRPQDAHQVGMLAQAVDGRGDIRIGRRALEVEEEHVLPEPAPQRPRLDAREVDRPAGELVQAGDQPARAARARAPEDQRGLRGAVARGGHVFGPVSQPG